MLLTALINSRQVTVRLIAGETTMQQEMAAMATRKQYAKKRPPSPSGLKTTTISFPRDQLATIEEAANLTGQSSISFFVSEAAFEKASAILEALEASKNNDVLIVMDRVNEALRAYHVAIGSIPRLGSKHTTTASE